jgi:hypothetical protein
MRDLNGFRLASWRELRSWGIPETLRDEGWTAFTASSAFLRARIGVLGLVALSRGYAYPPHSAVVLRRACSGAKLRSRCFCVESPVVKTHKVSQSCFIVARHLSASCVEEEAICRHEALSQA